MKNPFRRDEKPQVSEGENVPHSLKLSIMSKLRFLHNGDVLLKESLFFPHFPTQTSTFSLYLLLCLTLIVQQHVPLIVRGMLLGK